ncbi:hypothetical protein GN244_ATG01783 [Phytophthora infestans]|uniref:Uncharacterized protein n=1 Tax=Phytophthora infestans TaxID=4787 RepID=A0A833TFL6_PHYIN|nr:hypothetical protein GN244_ATG01783 [Phytophthora infestans]KAF4136581.1 hypothetical protein GN958_ATG14256 [Phytophthora infestans]
MFFDYPANVVRQKQQQRKQRQVDKANQQENEARDEREYQPEDWVMVARNGPHAPELQAKLERPYQVLSVRANDILLINKDKYVVRIHMRRVKPFKPSAMGEMLCQVDASRLEGWLT